jgi:hypothetical protein
MPETEVHPPFRLRHYIGWIILSIFFVPFICFSIYLHMKENQEMTARQEGAAWKDNWHRLKLGMTKQEVVALIGPPSNTTVFESQPHDISTDPPDENIASNIRQSLDEAENAAIWSYHGPIVIHTFPGEDLSKAQSEADDQLRQMDNFDFKAPLHGYAIRFNRQGRAIEIVPTP